MLKKTTSLLVSFLLAGIHFVTLAQPVSLPRVSPAAEISQSLGLTQVKINYSRPSVNGREIWGNVVPYDGGDPMPWRAGANENTRITFSQDVKIEGQALPAGSYSLHMIPAQEEVVLIFNKNTMGWGSYFYNPEEDVLRVSVKPEDCEHHELLTFDFISFDPQKGSGVCGLSWEKRRIPFRIESPDFQAQVLDHIRGELTSIKAFSWQSWNSAALYCLQNNVNLEEGLAWAERAVASSQGNFTTLSTKAGLLEKAGKAQASQEVMDKAFSVATNVELNAYGYQLLGRGKKDKAINIFEMNAKHHPEDPNVWDSLGEGYANRGAKGDTEKAIKAFKKSLSLDPPDNVKANSLRNLEALGVSTKDL